MPTTLEGRESRAESPTGFCLLSSFGERHGFSTPRAVIVCSMPRGFQYRRLQGHIYTYIYMYCRPGLDAD